MVQTTPSRLKHDVKPEAGAMIDTLQDNSTLVLDRAVLEDLKDGLNQSDLARLLDLTIIEFPALLERVVVAWREGNPINLANQAHKITGIAASFGVNELSATSDSIERECRTMQRTPSADLLDDLVGATNSALQAIAAWRTEHAI